MSRPTEINQYDKLVGLKYELYNSLFLTLPFPNLEQVGIKLPLFSERCQMSLEKEQQPSQIIKNFFQDIVKTKDFESQMRVLFLFLQFIERQVVLFDALELAAFPEIHPTDQEGSLNSLLRECHDSRSINLLQELLVQYRTRVVLTAHPTQFYPEAVLGIIRDLAKALTDDDLLSIEKILLQLGMTSFRNETTPTALSEAQDLLNRSHEVFYDSFIKIENEIDHHLGEKRPLHPLLELGFWPGGDRDGNPNVDVATTLKVAQELRQCAISHYRKEIAILKHYLTFTGIKRELDAIEQKLDIYSHPDELLADLDTLYNNLQQNNQGLFSEYVEHFQRAVRSFGFHFASLDLRQDSSIHVEVVDGILKKYQSTRNWPKECMRYLELNPEERMRLLETICDQNLQPIENVSLEEHPLGEDVLGSIRAIKAIQKNSGAESLRRYVISNTQGAYNVMEIYFLAKLVGIEDNPLDIIPLFETIQDLKQSDEVMKRLYHSDIYRRHLAKLENRQVIMVGFSDGTKDGGYVTCNWEIFKAKQRLEKLSAQAGIKVVFFDGRGGPPARGGGNTHKFYLAVGECLKQKEVQLTIQGQTISSNFGSLDIAQFNLEQLFTAGIKPKLSGKKRDCLNAKEVSLLDKLSHHSNQVYLELRNHRSFLPFLQEMTPLPHYHKLHVASRPAKRGTQKELQFKDLRAIPFVGAWSQIKLNIPGFYGLGSALKILFEEGSGPALKKMYREKLFFSTLMNNAMQSLAKTNVLYTKHILKDETYGPFVNRIHKEVELTCQYLLELTGQQELIETDPVRQQSIKMREKLILPLMVIQQYAMSQSYHCKDKKQREAYEKLLLKSLPTIINAGRNSC